MKIKLQKNGIFLKIMRISVAQIFLTLLCVGMAYAKDLSAQEVLEKRISIKTGEKTLKSVLAEIETEANLKFVYSSTAIGADRKVSLTVQNKTLKDLLDNFFDPLHIKYRLAGKKIILRYQKEEKKLSENIERTSGSILVSIAGITIKGKVTDAENGGGLPGVSVVIKGTNRGVNTDSNGDYSILVNDEKAVLVYSFVGYEVQEILVGNKTNLNVSLKVDTKALDEVIVVGYGTQKKKDITGAVSSIDNEMFKERKETQVSQALQGSMSGVLVTRNGSSGAMGSATIRIRGVTTIGNSDPLVIVDGVPVSDVNQVNPNDIENLTVLKDAASASIYGSRAASGVILITTKRAKTDQASLQYSYENGFDTPTQLPERMGALRYMELVNELRWNDAGNGANKYPTYTKELLDGYNEKHRADPDKYPDTDWVAMTLNKVARREAHSISVIGGSKFVKSNASLRYEKVGGFYDNKNYNRIFARSNNDFTINKLIGGTLDFNFKRTIGTDPAVPSPLQNIRIASPVYPAEWADGRVADGKAGDNIYGKVKYGGTDRNWYNQVGGRIALDIKPLEGLKFSAVLAPIFDFNQQKKFNKRVDVFSPTDPNQYITTLIDNGGGGGITTRLDENRVTNYSLTTQLLANYAKSFKGHDITGLAGYENYYFKGESMGASRDQYLFDTYPYLDQGPITLRDNFGTAFETAYRSFFGRVTYGYKDKYLLQANIRRDGSSRFNSNYRWGVFPSVSVGWVLSEEGFLAKQNVVSFLKLRASWGALGNERIGNYPSVGIMNFSNALFYQNNVVTSQQTAAQVQYAIQNISWEKTESTDFGVDANFLNNRLRFTGDVYFKQTKDMLLALQIPIFVGFENPNQNTGKMSTKGFDFDLSWTDRLGELKYSASVNLSQFKSVMGDLGGTEFLGDRIKKQGSEFDEWYGYRSLGIYQTQEDVNNSAKLSSNVKVGDMKYEDISGPAGVPDGKISPEYDRVFLGGSLPKWTYGGNVKLGYRGFDFGLTFQGVGFQNTNMMDYTDYNNANWGLFPVYLDGGNTWSMYNTPEQNLAAKYPRYTETNKGLNRAMSDFWFFNGGYFRLKNITLGYTLPQKVTSKIMSNGVRFYVSALDVLSINKYPTGSDPEGIGIVTTVIGGFTLGF
ncbi:SusC/RagA family TonB-linked outer membrane protein [Emticicia sp. CRIBPO]|nr:SusC/RagA family TonB-linked outer membrane protein [Emticicia sp. CRIBPO]